MTVLAFVLVIALYGLSMLLRTLSMIPGRNEAMAVDDHDHGKKKRRRPKEDEAMSISGTGAPLFHSILEDAGYVLVGERAPLEEGSVEAPLPVYGTTDDEGVHRRVLVGPKYATFYVGGPKVGDGMMEDARHVLVSDAAGLRTAANLHLPVGELR